MQDSATRRTPVGATIITALTLTGLAITASGEAAYGNAVLQLRVRGDTVPQGTLAGVPVLPAAVASPPAAGAAVTPAAAPSIETSEQVSPSAAGTGSGAETIQVVELPPPTEEARATVYARRYRISPALALQIVETALAEGVDPELAFRVVRVESVFRANARGPSGALGLTQLMPSTARAIDRSLRTEAQILEPETNLRTGFRYLRRLIVRYKGDVRLGVLAYNRGETAVDRALRAGRDPENGYSGKVLELGGRYQGPGVVEKR